MLLNPQLSFFKNSFEDALQQVLNNTQNNQYLQLLDEIIAYSVLGSGKRLRALLVYATNEILGGDIAIAHSSAIAIELLHAYSLVHDDLPCMDDDVLRRGKPTVHVKYGVANAVLVGDALQAFAFLVLADDEFGSVCAKKRIKMLACLAKQVGAQGMVGGQFIDMNVDASGLSLAELIQMHNLKTGALFTSCVNLPIILHEPPNEQACLLNSYIEKLGLAFQICDDILDATKSTLELGKTSGKDNKQNKSTFVSILGMHHAKQYALTLCDEAAGVLQVFGAKANSLLYIVDFIKHSISE